MRRPAGVVVSCIVLGLVACILLLAAVMFMFLSTMMGHFPIPAQPGQPAPDAAVLSGVMIGIGLVCLIPTAWAAITVVGLARMKTWARYSVMVIGGGLVLFSLLGIMGLALSHAMMTSAMAPTQSPAMLRFGMIFNGLFDLAVMGIGVWWLVYFAMRSTRQAFDLAAAPKVASAYPSAPSPYAASTYQVASYVPPVDAEAASIAQQPPFQEVPFVAVHAPPARPLTVTIIAVLLIIGGVLTFPFVFLSFPMFLFGAMLTGWAAHLVLAAFSVIGVLSGVGLLRLRKEAFYTACGFYILGLVNCGLILLPSVRDRMIAYQTDLMQKMSEGVPQPVVFDSHMMALMLIPGMLFSVIFCGVLLILLVRNRAAFDRPTLLTFPT